MNTVKAAGKWTRRYDLIVSRRKPLRGFGGLTELIKVGLWTDSRGRRRRTDLVGFGAASDVHGALRLAACGMERHPEGTAAHRSFRDWAWRLRQVQRLTAEAEENYWAQVRAHAGNVPVHDPAAIAAE